MKNILSVVLPAYNEGLMVGKTCRVLGEVLKGAGIPYELVLVNDGSSDNTWEEILKAGHKDPAVLGVRFSRNFGKEAAVFAGMAQASGDVVAVMDCDLQHPPETLIEMYDLWKQGYGVLLSAENKKQFFIPKNFAHGFVVLSDSAEFAYKCTDFYHPNDEGGLKWDDPEIGVKWPMPEGMTKEDLIISEKDQKWSGISSLKK